MLGDQLEHRALYQRALTASLATAIVLSLVTCSPRFGDSEADLVLEDLALGGSRSRLASSVVLPARQALRYVANERVRYAYLYPPAAETAAAILLIPGVAPDGAADPRLVRLARTLARAKFLVMTPDIPGFRKGRVRSSDVAEIVAAFRRLAVDPSLPPDTPLGMGAISFAVGPAVLAATHDELRERVRFLVGVGGYFDLRRVIAYLTTGALNPATGIDPALRPPNPRGKWVFALNNAELLERPGDVEIIRSFAREGARAVDQSLVQRPTGLSPAGNTLVELLLNEDPDRVAFLLARLPSRIREEIKALNPADQDLSRLRTHLILVHGRADDVIPFGESVDLAQSVPTGQSELFLIDGLAHVDLRPKRRDLVVLREALAALLARRDD